MKRLVWLSGTVLALALLSGHAPTEAAAMVCHPDECTRDFECYVCYNDCTGEIGDPGTCEFA